MFLPSHLHTGSGSDQKVPAPTGSGSATLVIVKSVTFMISTYNNTRSEGGAEKKIPVQIALLLLVIYSIKYATFFSALRK